jgi:primosomal protein N' (replication factor Y)
MTLYADVILPLPLPGTFTYQVGAAYAGLVRPGVRVSVQFGKKRTYAALVRIVHTSRPAVYKIKSILDVLDQESVVNEKQFRLWDWIGEYYMCTPGEIYKAALPSGLKVEKYKPKIQSSVRLATTWKEIQKTRALLESLKRAPAKYRLVRTWLDLTSHAESADHPGIKKKILLSKAGVSGSVLQSMLATGVFEGTEDTQDLFHKQYVPVREHAQLNELQQNARQRIDDAFREKDVVLLHGVTSSGKTEIYMHLIRSALGQDRQVLYLLPEIALTTQIVSRLRAVFGPEVVVYHSKFSDKERIETWRKMVPGNDNQRNQVRIVLGVRSSVFLPFDKLGLVIVDEEHENTYKQFDPAPRYHARDTAIMLARVHGAKVLLGTATPAVETYHNCMSGKYALVELSGRYLDLNLPEIKVVNTRELRRRKQMHAHFSPLLLDTISMALREGEQAILFQNRRGFSRFMECDQCGAVPHCIHCDVSLTYHRQDNRLTCHYCGYNTHVPETCPECGSGQLLTQGFGTEKIEEEIGLVFPDARIARMDLDTTRTRKSYEMLISGFEHKEADILVGTQMVSKGLDFDNVKVVGIINADNMLNYPDFRAHERSFQLMAQVSGRAGRKTSRGMVIIQTSDHTHPVIEMVMHNDYQALYRYQLEERERFLYPPFARLIRITLRHNDRNRLDGAAGYLATMLRNSLNETIMGPEYPIIGRIKDQFLKALLIKIRRGRQLMPVKAEISAKISRMLAQPSFHTVHPVVDVDPY